MQKRKLKYNASHGQAKGPYDRKKRGFTYGSPRFHTMVKQEPSEGSSTSSGHQLYCMPSRRHSPEDDTADRSLRRGGSSAFSGHHPYSRPSRPSQREDPTDRYLRPGTSTSSGHQLYCMPSRRHSLGDDTTDRSLRPVSGGPSQETYTESLVWMIVTDLQPLSIIEGAGFQKFVRALTLGHSIPAGISTIRSELLQLYESVKSEVKASLLSASDVVLTSEAWTRGKESYQTVSCHFINYNWEHKSYVLETKDLTGKNTGDEIVSQLQTISKEWKIQEKIHAVTTNWPKVLPADSWTHVPCFAHTLDLAFKDALKHNQAHEALLKKCCQAVRFLHQSTKAADKLKDSLPPHQLTLSEETRWNYTFYMLEKLSQHHSTNNHILSQRGQKSLCLNDCDLSEINSMVSALRLFKDATEDMLQENYSPISWIIPAAKLLREKLGLLAQNGNKLAKELGALLKRRFAGIENHSKLAASTTLDARFKGIILSGDSSAGQKRTEQLLKELISLGKASQSTCTTTTSPGICPEGLWENFDRESECREELRRYTTIEAIPRAMDPLAWWRSQKIEFPNLERAARKYLAMVSTCAPTARAFTRAGQVFSLQRLHLELENINMMLFLNGNCILPQNVCSEDKSFPEKHMRLTGPASIKESMDLSSLSCANPFYLK